MGVSRVCWLPIGNSGANLARGFHKNSGCWTVLSPRGDDPLALIKPVIWFEPLEQPQLKGSAHALLYLLSVQPGAREGLVNKTDEALDAQLPDHFHQGT